MVAKLWLVEETECRHEKGEKYIDWVDVLEDSTGGTYLSGGKKGRCMMRLYSCAFDS